MTDIETILTKLKLAGQGSVKNSSTEIYENPINGLVADI
jgi:hypothetical protein